MGVVRFSLSTTRVRIVIITMSSNSNRHGEWPLDAKIYIGDLGNDATRYELEDAFNPFGTVKNVWIAKRPPGFAFILMEDSRDAEDAVKELDGTRICGRRVKVQMSKPRSGGDRRDRDRRRSRDRSRDRSRSRERQRSRSRSRSRGRRHRSISRDRDSKRRRDRD